MAKTLTKNAEVLPVTDSLTGVTTLFVVDKPEISAFVISRDSIIDEFGGIRPAENSSDLMGYSLTSGKYHLYFSNNSHTEFTIATVDFAKRQFKTTRSEIKIDKERFVGSASYNDRFYVLTVVRQSSTLKLYIFEGDENFTVKSFSFEGTHFIHGKSKTLERAINVNNEAFRIDNEIPNTVSASSKLNKLYCFNNHLMLTFDISNNTRLLYQ